MIKRLSLEETLECLKKWRESRDKEALTLLVLSNQGLVKHFAYKYYNSTIPKEDLESIGNEALIRAIHQFDYINRPIGGFSAYIIAAIEHQINNEFKKNNKHSQVISLSQPAYQGKDGTSISLESMISYDAGDEFDKKVESNTIDEVLQNLTEKQRKIIILRYGLKDSQNRTLEEVGEILGCSRQAIHQQEQKALQRLRKPIYARKLGGFITK